MREEVDPSAIARPAKFVRHEKVLGRGSWRRSRWRVLRLQLWWEAAPVPLLIAAIAEVHLARPARPETRERVSEPALGRCGAVSEVADILEPWSFCGAWTS